MKSMISKRLVTANSFASQVYPTEAFKYAPRRAHQKYTTWPGCPRTSLDIFFLLKLKIGSLSTDTSTHYSRHVHSYDTEEPGIESKAPNLLTLHPPNRWPLSAWSLELPFLTKDGTSPILYPCGPCASNTHVSHCSEENKADMALRILELVRVARFARMNR